MTEQTFYLIAAQSLITLQRNPVASYLVAPVRMRLATQPYHI